MKIFFYNLIAFFFLINISFAHGAESSPGELVKEFYQWYLPYESDSNTPIRDSVIYKYVSRCTVKRLRIDLERGTLPGGVDYFTKVHDYDVDDWVENITIHENIKMNEYSYVVPVTLGLKNKKDIIVFVSYEDNSLYITKIDDTRPYL